MEEKGAGAPVMDVYEDCGKMEGSEILYPGVPTAAQNGMSYHGSGAPSEAHNGVVLLGPGATPSVATSGVACPDALRMATLSSAVPPATWNAVPYPDWLTAQLSSGAAAPTLRNGVAYPDGLMPQLSVVYPDVLMEHFGSTQPPASMSSASHTDMLTAHLGSTLSTADQSGASDPGMLMAHLGSGAPSAALNGVAYGKPGGLSADTTASENAVVGNAIDVYEGVAGFGFEHLLPTGGVAAAAPGQDGRYDDRSGVALHFAAQVAWLQWPTMRTETAWLQWPTMWAEGSLSVRAAAAATLDAWDLLPPLSPWLGSPAAARPPRRRQPWDCSQC